LSSISGSYSSPGLSFIAKPPEKLVDQVFGFQPANPFRYLSAGMQQRLLNQAVSSLGIGGAIYQAL
jgi:hypothetical protein